MIVIADQLFQLFADKPADQGHERLEKSKGQTNLSRLPKAYVIRYQSGGDRNGESVETQADRDQKVGYKLHEAEFFRRTGFLVSAGQR